MTETHSEPQPGEQRLQLAIPLVLPDVEDERDGCVTRLVDSLRQHRGVLAAHADRQNGQAFLCLHYNPNLVPLAQVQRLAEEAGSEISSRYRHETYGLKGMDCASCAGSIEHGVRRLPGVLNVTVNYPVEKMKVEYDSTLVTAEKIQGTVRSMGYGVVDLKRPTPQAVREGHEIGGVAADRQLEPPTGWISQNWELSLSLAAALLLASGFFGEHFFGLPFPAAISLYLLAYASGGYDLARHSFGTVVRGRFDVEFLMLAAAVGAAVLGEWAEGALLLVLFSFGHAMEHFAMERARNAIQALGSITPKTARVTRDGRQVDVPVEELKLGDLAIIRSGERVAVDGKILSGRSAVDQSPITGESVPVDKAPGDGVFAGSINGEGALEVEVTKLAKDTTMSRVIKMVEEAQTQKSPTQRFTERFETIFVPVVLVIVVVAMVLPPLAGWLSWKLAILRGLSTLVAASPCALALATPAAVLAGIGQAARNGVLIKGGVHLENLGALEAIALDKTGTITRGKPEVTDVVPFEGIEERELLRVAGAVEGRSMHPLAQAVFLKAQQAGITLPATGELQSVTGKGVQAEVEGKLVRIGSFKLFRDAGIPLPPEVEAQATGLQQSGKTIMLVGISDRLAGVLALADQPRAETPATLAKLKEIGIKSLIMLTGDNDRVAAAIAAKVGLTDYRGDLMPEDKVTAIKELLEKYGRVAMVGDGVNDAPALANATVGIAMGAGGTDVALETADVALMASDLSKLPFAVGLSRQARRIIQQNLVISLGVIALLVPSTLFGLAGIGIAVIFHEGSTLLVVANALRLLRYGAKQA